jgi:hypothetical protein
VLRWQLRRGGPGDVACIAISNLSTSSHNGLPVVHASKSKKLIDHPSLISPSAALSTMTGSVMSPPSGLMAGQDAPDAFQQYLKEAEARQGQACHAAEHYQQELRRIDQERDQAYNSLTYMYKQLLDKYTQKCEDFENEVASRRMWHRDATENKRQLEQLELATVSCMYLTLRQATTASNVHLS